MNDMKTMNIKSTDNRVQSTDNRVQSTESGSVPGSVLATIRKASVLRTLYSVLSPVLCTLCSVLLISSCTHDEIIPPVNTTNDALALLPGNTPVGIKAEITDNREQSTTTRAEGDESATTYYAWNELHETSNLDFVQMLLPGGVNRSFYKENYNSTINNLSTTEPFSTLMLKDFNLVPDGTRQVSRWAVMEDAFIYDNNVDHLKGAARLTLNAETQQPELNFTLMHSGAKLTVKVVDADGNPMPTTGMTVKATMQKLYLSSPGLLYAEPATPSGYYKHLVSYLQSITSLEADEAVNADKIVWALAKGSTTKEVEVELKPLVDASGTAVADNTYSNMVSAVVYATPTHTSVQEDGDETSYYTPIAGGPQFTDTDKLTITVNTDPDGDGPQTTGTYSLKLSEVKLSDTENLTALEPGKHYTLTVTLRHNTLVAATATIGAWSTASANVNIGGDGAFMPSYTYDAASNTYNVYQSEGIEEALKARTDENSTLVYFGTTVVPSGVTNDKIVVLSGATTDLATVQAAIAGKTHIIATGTELAAYNGTATTVVGEAIRQLTIDENGATDANSELTSTISFVMPDATTIGDNAFNGCSALKTLTFGSSIKSLGTNAFSGINAEISYNGIPLKMDADGQLWIDKVTGNKYYSELPAIIANGSLCVKVDGTCGGKNYGITDDDINKMKILIQSAIAKGVTRVYVTGTFLSEIDSSTPGYLFDGPKTVLGMAISQLNVADRTINVFLPEVETIPDGAFNRCPAIKNITYGQ